MFGDRRRHQRYTINRIARLETDGGASSRECTITDISEQGARLFVAGAEVPDRFRLLISGEKVVREECQVVWRLGGEVGVTFVTRQQDKERLDLMNRLRAEAQEAFRGVA